MTSYAIQLLPLHAEQAAIFLRWIQDPEVIAYSLSVFQQLNTLAEVTQWLTATLADTRSLTLGIYLAETEDLIGYAGITSISTVNQSGEYFILVGDKQYWGKGIATTVTRQIVARGFAELGLNRIMLTVSEPNKGGVKAYRRAGFQVEGRLRQACFRKQAFHDKLVMSVLREEWTA
ncbi:GNAT family N-acetyltransferase [Hymenobacter sp. J193]|uniref:GNAT family N-acetyltransferase n=1 Tax=Hymenobacter sp. J193 TaxID=2898429 RepID=UPI00215085DC|nr:GNAT family protein [Hymenobacter sp. J193]MCR5890127.1 GNAT family N-acetyltransferase [Hymenobacter sp. J193]